jgi:hypothetical protein
MSFFGKVLLYYYVILRQCYFVLLYHFTPMSFFVSEYSLRPQMALLTVQYVLSANTLFCVKKSFISMELCVNMSVCDNMQF